MARPENKLDKSQKEFLEFLVELYPDDEAWRILYAYEVEGKELEYILKNICIKRNDREEKKIDSLKRQIQRTKNRLKEIKKLKLTGREEPEVIIHAFLRQYPLPHFIFPKRYEYNDDWEAEGLKKFFSVERILLICGRRVKVARMKYDDYVYNMAIKSFIDKAKEYINAEKLYIYDVDLRYKQESTVLETDKIKLVEYKWMRINQKRKRKAYGKIILPEYIGKYKVYRTNKKLSNIRYYDPITYTVEKTNIKNKLIDSWNKYINSIPYEQLEFLKINEYNTRPEFCKEDKYLFIKIKTFKGDVYLRLKDSVYNVILKEKFNKYINL